MSDLEFANDNERNRTVGRLVMEGIVAALVAALFVYGPLWPVGRLIWILRSSDTALTADGIPNPPRDRLFSVVALALFLGALACLWLAFYLHESRFLAGTGILGLLYLEMTGIIFEWRIMRWLNENDAA